MHRSLLVAIPFALAVVVAYAVAFVAAGHPLQPGPIGLGALGWFAALVLRTPVGLVGLRRSGDTDRAQRWVIASSGPLEETARLALLLLVGRDLDTALWIGVGWAGVEVLYSILNGFALAALAERHDPEAQQAKAMLPPAAFTAAGPWWGVVERVWVSAAHIGFTLIVAAVPLLVLITAPLHTAMNLAFLRYLRAGSLARISLLGSLFGGSLLLVGFLLH